MAMLHLDRYIFFLFFIGINISCSKDAKQLDIAERTNLYKQYSENVASK